MEKTLNYVHGYSEKESKRLSDQANTLNDILHFDSLFDEGSLVLEAGCGVGSQTKIIASKNPGCRFHSLDISKESLAIAEAEVAKIGITNVVFSEANIYHLPFDEGTFDAVFICFVLEHLPDPLLALNEAKRVLKKGGKLMIIEGDHGSTFFYPESEAAQRAILAQVQLQKLAGGNSNIGRQLYPILSQVGLERISVTPRVVYVDGSKPNLIEGFTKKTFTAMIEGVRENAVENGIISELEFDKGIKDLYQTANSDGMFSYTFFKGTGLKTN